jgi:hypothetical protein
MVLLMDICSDVAVEPHQAVQDERKIVSYPPFGESGTPCHPDRLAPAVAIGSGSGLPKKDSTRILVMPLDGKSRVDNGPDATTPLRDICTVAHS